MMTMSVSRAQRSVEVIGAVGDNATDDSAAWTASINRLGDLGGGTLHAAPGRTYIVQGLPIREHVYIELNGSTLRLPPSPTSSMFLGPSGFPEGAGFYGGGIMHGTLDGRDQTQHGIDFTTNGMGRLERFIVDDVYLDNFDRAYTGSLNDRQPTLAHCRFRTNKVGVYIRVNHPIIRDSTFRNNDIGLTCEAGSRIQDVQLVGCKFVQNGVHIAPGAGGEVQGNTFTGCLFYKHSDSGPGVIVGDDNAFTGCEFVGLDGSDIGLALDGIGNSVVGCNFGWSYNETAADCFGVAAIRVQRDENNISGNMFWLLSTSSVGVVGHEVNIRLLNVSANTARLAGGARFVVVDSPTAVIHSVIDGNVIDVTGTGLSSGQGIIEIDTMSGLGVNITNNVFVGGSTISTGHAISLGQASSAIITGNKFRNFDDAIAMTSGGSTVIFGHNIGIPGGLDDREIVGGFNAPVMPAVDDGESLGTASLRWSDIHLASGAEVKVGGQRVLTSQQQAIPNLATSDDISTKVNTILAALRTHGLISPALEDAILALSPTGYWRLNGASGDLVDSAGDEDATVTGSPTYSVTSDVPVHIGTAMTFSGDGQYGTTSADIPDPTESMSVLALIRTTDETAGFRFAVGRGGTGGGHSWGLGLHSSHVARFVVTQANGSAHAQATIANALNDGEWHLIAGTFDGTTMRLYRDLASNSSTSLTGTWQKDSNAGVQIAAYGSDEEWVGDLAHIVYWADRVLTSDEVANLYNVAMWGA